MAYTFSNMRQFGKKLVEFLLTFIQLSSTSVVNSKEGHDAVDDEETVLVPDEELGNLVQKLHLMLGVDSTSVGDVVLRYAPLVRYSTGTGTGTGTRTCLLQGTPFNIPMYATFPSAPPISLGSCAMTDIV
jgi:hypothetical protein